MEKGGRREREAARVLKIIVPSSASVGDNVKSPSLPFSSARGFWGERRGGERLPFPSSSASERPLPLQKWELVGGGFVGHTVQR